MRDSSGRTQFVIILVFLTIMAFGVGAAIRGEANAPSCAQRVISTDGPTPGLMPHANQIRCMQP